VKLWWIRAKLFGTMTFIILSVTLRCPRFQCLKCLFNILQLLLCSQAFLDCPCMIFCESFACHNSWAEMLSAVKNDWLTQSYSFLAVLFNHVRSDAISSSSSIHLSRWVLQMIKLCPGCLNVLSCHPSNIGCLSNAMFISTLGIMTSLMECIDLEFHKLWNFAGF
jgi:hypothetical protein